MELLSGYGWVFQETSIDHPQIRLSSWCVLVVSLQHPPKRGFGGGSPRQVGRPIMCCLGAQVARAAQEPLKRRANELQRCFHHQRARSFSELWAVSVSRGLSGVHAGKGSMTHCLSSYTLNLFFGKAMLVANVKFGIFFGPFTQPVS